MGVTVNELCKKEGKRASDRRIAVVLVFEEDVLRICSAKWMKFERKTIVMMN